MEGGAAILILLVAVAVLAVGGVIAYLMGVSFGLKGGGEGGKRQNQPDASPPAEREWVVEDRGEADVGPDEPSPRRARVRPRTN